MLSGLEELILFGFVPLMIGTLVWPTSSRTAEGAVTGTVTIPPYRKLPGAAVTTVELVELRQGETAMPVLARETTDWRGSKSQKFTIRFDPTFIRPTAYYAVQARIIVDGATWFETQYPQPVAPLAGDPMTLTLVPRL